MEREREHLSKLMANDSVKILSSVDVEEACQSDHKDHDGNAFSHQKDHLLVYHRELNGEEEDSDLEHELFPTLPYEAFHSDPLEVVGRNAQMGNHNRGLEEGASWDSQETGRGSKTDQAHLDEKSDHILSFSGSPTPLEAPFLYVAHLVSHFFYDVHLQTQIE